MKPLIVLCVLWCCCLGCQDVQKPVDVQEPRDLNVHVDVVRPIAKLVRAIPATTSRVHTEETITLEFTEVPENLKISVPPPQYEFLRYNAAGFPIPDGAPDQRFYIRFEYNGDTRPRFVISVWDIWGIERDKTYPVRVVVQWTHGYKELNFDVKRK